VPNIRIIRQQNEPGDRGPSRGMYALQKALRERDIPWLKVGGPLKSGDIPWIWLYKDANLAIHFNDYFGWPFILGPNVLFWDSYNPGKKEYERKLLDANSCALMFTESLWYAALIQQNCNHNEAPIKIWPYPIDPQPDGPLAPEFDLLIYLKDMTMGREAIRAQERWPKSNLVTYGRYDRNDLIELARRSRACLYLCNDDRGPLAAAEIALAGCPLVGVERGCPWTTEHMLGVNLPHFSTPVMVRGVEAAMDMDRHVVRKSAQKFFDADGIVDTVVEALEPLVN